MPAREAQVKLKYKPNAKQKIFHGSRPGIKYRGFCGGWGNGKTSAGCAEFFIRLMEYPGTNSIIARKTRPELRTTTWDMLVNGDPGEGVGNTVPWHGIPREVIEQHNKSDLYIKLRNGSQIHGLPLDDPKKLENYNIGLYLVDQGEEVEEEFFIKFSGRLRQLAGPREGIWLFNPNGHNWLWRRFIDPSRPDRYKARYHCVEATPLDNPNLPPDFLEQFEHLPKHWYDRYVLGSHDVFVGQIFVDFNPDLHVIDPFYIPPEWERWCSIDPGIGHEGAVNWMARDWHNNVYVYREIVKAGEPVEWWAEAIEDAETARDYGGPDEQVMVRLIGPEANQRAQTDGHTVRELYEEEGIETEVADRDPVARINRITQRLRPTVNHDHPTGLPPVEVFDLEHEEVIGKGAPRLYIFNTCEYTVEWLPQYKWRPQRVSFLEEDPPEKPLKKNDHTVDNIGHVLVAIGDSEPEVPAGVLPGPWSMRTAEAKELDEHFEEELAAAGGDRPVVTAAMLNGGRS